MPIRFITNVIGLIINLKTNNFYERKLSPNMFNSSMKHFIIKYVFFIIFYFSNIYFIILIIGYAVSKPSNIIS